MESEAQKQPFPNDIFISYSRKDIEFARRLEKALEAYKPPKDLKETPHRNLVVFRDEEDITGVEYHQSIERHLKDSAKLIVICSPNARKSDYVNDEIRLFAKLNGPQNIVPVLLSGIPNNEAKPDQEDEKAFPETLCEAMQMPLATSYLGFDTRKYRVNKGTFSGSWYKLLADIYDVGRSEIEQREKKKQARKRNFLIGTAVVAIVILSGLTTWALFSRKEAVNQKNIAEERLAKNYWSNAVDARKNDQWLQAAHFLARFGELEKKTQRVRNCIFTMQAYTKNLFLGYQVRHETAIGGVVLSKDESLILTWGGNAVRLWHTKDGSPATQPMKHEGYVDGARFNKDESLILTWGMDDTVRLWHTKDGSPAAQPMKHAGGLIKGVHATFNKDESLILTWGNDGTAQLWHTKDGSPAAQPLEHAKRRIGGFGDRDRAISVQGATFNKDGSLVLTWGMDGTARLWYTKDGSPAAQPMEHAKRRIGGFGDRDHEISVQGATFNKDESLVLTWGMDGTARLWYTKDGSPAAQPMEHQGMVHGATFNKDESLILTQEGDGTVRLWHTKDGSPAAQPMEHKDRVYGAIFNKDESLILTWSKDGMARLWHTKDGSPASQPMKHEKHHFSEYTSKHKESLWFFGITPGATFNKDESLILTWSEDGTARLWHTKDGSPASQPMEHEGSVQGATFNKDESLILTWSDDAARLWYTKNGSSTPQPIKHEGSVQGATFNKDESLILTWSEDYTARLWHAKAGSPAAQTMQHDDTVRGAIFNKDESLILTWSEDGTARLWHTKDGSPASQPMKHEKHFFSEFTSKYKEFHGFFGITPGATFNKDESLILAWGGGCTAQLWHAKDGSPASQPMEHQRNIHTATFNTDESLILTWSDDSTVCLWHAKDGSPAAQPVKHEGSFDRATFNKDGSLILTWGRDSTARLWYTRDGSPAAQPMKHEGSVQGASFNKDGSLILTWSEDGTARLWNTKDGSPAAQPMKHTGSVHGATFNKEESLILTWSGDGTARLWHTKDGSPAAQPMKHESSVQGATFNKDESLILTWSEDGTARLWHIPADYDFPKIHLPLLVEVVTGTVMDDLGNVTVLNPKEWRKRKERYIEIAEKHLTICQHKDANIYVKQKQFWGEEKALSTIDIVKKRDEQTEPGTPRLIEKPEIRKVTFRSKPIEKFNEKSVRSMLQRYNFYCTEYDRNKEFSNPQGSGFHNKFELQDKDGDRVITDHTSGLTWQQSGSKEYMTYNQAKIYIRQLNQGEGFAGYRDWRLPTLEEAMSLMEPTKNDKDFYIDPLFDTEQDGIWTSDFYKTSSPWVVDFRNGFCHLHFDFHYCYKYVRAVR